MAGCGCGAAAAAGHAHGVRGDSRALAAPTQRACARTPARAEGAGIFRVEARAPRGTRTSAGGSALVAEDVTFAAPMRVLFWKRAARTTMRQESRVSGCGRRVDITFELIQSVRRAAAEGAEGAWMAARVCFAGRARRGAGAWLLPNSERAAAFLTHRAPLALPPPLAGPDVAP